MFVIKNSFSISEFRGFFLVQIFIWFKRYMKKKNPKKNYSHIKHSFLLYYKDQPTLEIMSIFYDSNEMNTKKI